MKSHRLARVAEAIREVAAETILFRIKDPRVKNVTVTRAEVSADLLNAKVYVSVLGSQRQQSLALHGLEHAAGFVQSQLAKRLTTRCVPSVRFVLDEGVKKSLEISRILAEENARCGTVAETSEPAEDGWQALGDESPDEGSPVTGSPDEDNPDEGTPDPGKPDEGNPDHPGQA